MPTLKQCLLAVLCFIGIVTFAQTTIDFDKYQVLNEISKNVKQHFYKANLDTLGWTQGVEECRQQLAQITTLDDFDFKVNELLATLNTSHTYFYSRNNPKMYQLLGIFDELFETEDTNLFCYEGIGIDIKTVDGKTFIAAVYDGLPAANAGLRFGDQLVSVDDTAFHPIRSFAGKTNSNVMVKVVRDKYQLLVNVPVITLDGRSMFETALRSSIRVVQRNKKKIGYVHMWSYAGFKYQEQLRNIVLWGELSECDALIIDVRDGWGGADINYLNLFRRPIATIKSTHRNEGVGTYSGVWGKPVVLITNRKSTSGKELFTYGFKKLKLGKVIGEKTAGAVMAGRIFKLSSGDVLYLAVNDIHVDGIRLEGIGVIPDIPVERPLTPTESEGFDAPLERAFEELSR